MIIPKPSLSLNPVPIISPQLAEKMLRTVLTEYADVFDNTVVGCIKNYEYDITLKPNTVPVIHASRKVPFALRDAVVNELRRMEQLGVIAKVQDPSEWVNSMVIVERPEKLRICLDPSSLNKCVMREHTYLPTVDEVLSQISDAKFFTKLDLKDGYWQIPLSYESSLLTTFNTHIGRFRYTRLPFGLNSANEIFQKQVSQVYERIEGVMVMYDDILVYGKSEAEHNERLEEALARTREYGIKLNKNKCKFQVKEVKYVGHIISSEGIKVDPDKVNDILQMPRPDDKKGVERLIGTLNFLARYINNLLLLLIP